MRNTALMSLSLFAALLLAGCGGGLPNISEPETRGDAGESESFVDAGDPESLGDAGDTETPVDAGDTETPVDAGEQSAPRVSWEAPKNNATVEGVLNEVNGNCFVTVTANAAFDRVEFLLDDVLLNTERGAPYSCLWDTREAAPGSTHRLSAVAYDQAGRSGEATIQVTVASGSSDPTPHILGGFGAYSKSAMQAIDDLGMSAVMDYISITSGLGAAHSSLTNYSNQASSLGLKMIDDIPQQLVDRFHKGGNTDMNTLVADMTAHVKYLVANPELKSKIVAYWIIDDWYEDFGAAKIALQKITALTHQYTPGIPTICGFTGNTSYGGTVSGYTNFAKNFSASGCDMVGVYLYPYGSNKPPMTNLLNIKAALKNNGWDISKTPLVGIPQSYGAKNGYYVPTAAQVRSQTKYFCEQGATHILFYDFHTGTSAATELKIQTGIREGLADCRTIWGY